MPSFDVVSRTDLAEVDNALNNMTREMDQRYDFKGSSCKVERLETGLVVHADDDLKLRQMHELLQGHLSRRKVDIKILDYGEPEPAAGQAVRQNVTIRQGIDRDSAGRIVKQVKAAKLKVQVAIQGDELRITGKKRDDLQAVIQVIKSMPLDVPVQFVNMRD